MRFALAFAVWVGLCAPAFADAKDDLGLLPVDSDLVGGLDLTKLQKSAVWKKYVEPLLASGDVKKGLDEFKTTCNVDPMKLATKLTFGMKQTASGDPDVVLVVHGMPKGKLTACLAKPGIDAKKDGDIYVATPKDGQPMAFKFIDDSTAFAILGTNATADAVRAAVKGGGIKASQAFLDLYKNTNTGETVWMIANGNAKMFDTMQSTGMRPKAVFGSAALAGDVTATVRLRLDSADKASQVSTMLQGQIAQAQTLFDKLVVGAAGADVTVALVLGPAKLDNLVKTLGGMMGKGP
jgi:hypothetical protein